MPVPSWLRPLVTRRPTRPCRRLRPISRQLARPRLTVLEDRTVPATFTWIGTGDGSWNDGANWDQGGSVPGATDDVIIAGNNFTVTDAPAQLNSLSVRSCTVVGADDLTIHDLDLAQYGAVQVTGNVTVTGTLSAYDANGNVWCAGTLFVGGTAVVAEGLFVTGSVVSSGTWDQAGFLQLGPGEAFTNAGTLRLHAAPLRVTDLQEDHLGEWALVNQGVLEVSGATDVAAAFTNDMTGTVLVAADARFRLLGGGAVTGQAGVTTIEGGTGSLLEFHGVTCDASSSIAADAAAFYGTNAVNGSYEAGTSTTVVPVRIDSPVAGRTAFSGTITGLGDAVSIDFAELDLTAATLPAPFTLANLTLTRFGNLFAPGDIHVTGALVATDHNGNIHCGGTLFLDAGATATVVDGLHVGGSVVNASTWDQANFLELAPGKTFTNTGTVRFGVNELRGSGWTFRNEGTATADGAQLTGAANVVNAGTFQVSSATLNLGGTFDNQGLVDLTAGSLNLKATGTSSGAFQGGAGTTLSIEPRAGSTTSLTFTPGATVTGQTLSLSGVTTAPGADISGTAVTLFRSTVGGAYQATQTQVTGNFFTPTTFQGAAPGTTVQLGALTVGGGRLNLYEDVAVVGPTLVTGYLVLDNHATVDAGGATLTVANGAYLAGGGTVRANVVVPGSGNVMPGVTNEVLLPLQADVLTVDGDLSLSPTSRVFELIGGTAVGTGTPNGYSRLTVTGQAGVAGTLQVIPFAGYAPPAGAAFQFFTCGSRDPDPARQDFAQRLGLEVAPGHTLTPVTGPADAWLIADIGSGGLQAVVDALPEPAPGAPAEVTIDAAAAEAPAVFAAISGLDPGPTGGETVLALNVVLSAGKSEAVTVSVPDGAVLYVDGSPVPNGTTLDPATPAFTLTRGTAVISHVTMFTFGNAPTVLVTGGHLTLRDCIILESDTANQAAVRVTGGTVDLGTAADPGGNTLAVRGAGEFVRNLGANHVPALGNTLTVDGAAIASPFRVEDRTYHALDAAGPGLVTYAAGTVHVTPASGSIQRGVGVVAAGGTVNVEAGNYAAYTVGVKLLTVAFQGGPTLAQRPDAVTPGRAELAVIGTAGNDSVHANPGGAGGSVTVTVNGLPKGTFAPTGRLAVSALGGNDDVQVAGGVRAPAWLSGGDGNDRLKGGGGYNVLLGGAGDDQLIGGAARDLLLGGAGADKLSGNDEDDILIAGTTAFDTDVSSLAAIMAEWTSTRDYATRVDNLRGTGTGSAFASRLNGDVFLRAAANATGAATVFNDSSIDVLLGGSGRDWFFANASGGLLDWLPDDLDSEFVDELV